jgi:hypothetical protein
MKGKFIADQPTTNRGNLLSSRTKAASMTSLLAGGTPSKAIDETYLALSPRDTAQHILNQLPEFSL